MFAALPTEPRRFRPALPLTALGLLLALACGGHGGGGPVTGTTGTGYGLAPATGPGDTSRFFPAEAGDVWFYDTTFVQTTPASANLASFEEIRVTGTQPFLGQQATVFRETDASGGTLDTYFLKTPGGVTALGTGDATDWLTTTIGPYWQMTFPLTTGTVADFTRTGYSIGQDLDGDGHDETLTAHVTVAVAGYETVTVPAGTFPGAVKVLTTLEGSVRGSKAGATLPFTSTQTSWAAPGVGIVKTSTATDVDGTVVQTGTAARGFLVDGAGRGLTTPRTLVPDLDGADPYASEAEPPLPGRGGLASDGAGFMALTTAPGPGTGRSLKACLFSDETSATVVDLTPANATALTFDAAALAFDGTNYLAVCGQGNSYGLGPLLGVRVSPAGGVLDPQGLVLASWGGNRPSAAPGGQGTLVVYHRLDPGKGGGLVYGVLVGADGTVGTEFPVLGRIGSDLTNAAVACDGTQFLVVASATPIGGLAPSSLLATRVSFAGEVLDPAPLTLVASACVPGPGALAFDPADRTYLLTWADARSAPVGGPVVHDLYGARLAPDGTLLDGTPAASGFLLEGGGTLDRADPSVAFLGAEGKFLVTWSLGAFPGTGDPGIHGLKVAPAGAPDGAVFRLSGPPPSFCLDAYPVVAARRQGWSSIWLCNATGGGTKFLEGLLGW